MSTLRENLSNRILDCLNTQEPLRCRELSILFGHSSVRELQHIFPILIRSIFGICDDNQNGWGLRTTLRDANSVVIFDSLYNFFAPMGAMLKMCYRLVQESFKFEVNISLLPHRFLEMLQSLNYSLFYTDLINIDPFTREMTSLSLNAFDYYMLHFVLHGIVPLHKKFSIAEQVHNDCSRTVYFMLCSEYFATFLPSNVDAIIPPADLCLIVKATQPLPVPTLRPHRSPKYLKIPSNTLYADNSTHLNVTGPTLSPNVSNQNSRLCSFSGELVRNNTWRTESVLHLFVDISLREDIDSVLHLPSSEFIRIVRLLIKQIHAFALAAQRDDTTMATIRYAAQPLLKERIFPFLRSIIARWPLDSSMTIVLELWYTYIQPWRYEHLNEISNITPAVIQELPNDGRYDSFIADNLFIYTQIFVQVLPRFQRLDFTMHQNCLMLHRLVRVFAQSIGADILQAAEQRYLNSVVATNTIHKRASPLANKTNLAGGNADWEKYFLSDLYVPMFDTAMQMEMEKFINMVYLTRMHICCQIDQLYEQQRNEVRSYGIFRHIIRFLRNDVSNTTEKLNKIGKIPELLEHSLRLLCGMFRIDMPTQLHEHYTCKSEEFSGDEDMKEETFNFNRSSPKQMRQQLQKVLLTPAIDPALLPVQMHESRALVRLLHQISSTINEMFGNEIQSFWMRRDFWGKLARQILLPPMTAVHFDKIGGYSELCEEKLPARLCLRTLGSYRSLTLLIIALLFGQILWSAPSFGLLMLILITTTYYFILAIIAV